MYHLVCPHLIYLAASHTDHYPIFLNGTTIFYRCLNIIISQKTWNALSPLLVVSPVAAWPTSIGREYPAADREAALCEDLFRRGSKPSTP